MKYFTARFFLILFLFLASVAFAEDQGPHDLLQLIEPHYQQVVLGALKESGHNRQAWVHSIESVDPQQRQALVFLLANMPAEDLKRLRPGFIIDNDQWAYKAIGEVPWGPGLPKEIFLNAVLPYASVNERRDRWRGDFYRRFMRVARRYQTIDEAVVALNKYVFNTFQVSYNLARRPKPDQSPYESIRAHYASCTGLSILLIDALRSVGIPARMAAITMWPDGSGNHTWVEVWDGRWRYIGAGEPAPLDHTWFTPKASHTDSQHPIYATSFEKTGVIFPMRWAPEDKSVPAVEVTESYTHRQ